MAMPMGVPAGIAAIGAHSGSNRTAEGLVAEASADSDAFTPDGAAAAQHGSAALGLHARTESVSFHALAAIGLKCALGHGYALLFPGKNLRLDGKF
jgi:hypothetical protein